MTLGAIRTTVRALVDWAYQTGFHEVGYDVVSDFESAVRADALYEAAAVASTECGVCDDKHLPDGPCLISVEILRLAGKEAPPPGASNARVRSLEEALRNIHTLIKLVRSDYHEYEAEEDIEAACIAALADSKADP